MPTFLDVPFSTIRERAQLLSCAQTSELNHCCWTIWNLTVKHHSSEFKWVCRTISPTSNVFSTLSVWFCISPIRDSCLPQEISAMHCSQILRLLGEFNGHSYDTVPPFDGVAALRKFMAILQSSAYRRHSTVWYLLCHFNRAALVHSKS